MEPFLWTSSEDTRPLWRQFDRDGACWVRMDGAAEVASHSPRRLIEILCGWRPLAMHVDHLPAEDAPEAASLHVDAHPYLPPALEILVCVRPGGASRMIDTWQLLAELRERGSPLFGDLFETQRIMRFPGFLWYGPTFSVRAGNLVCVHNGTPLKTDSVGRELERVIGRQHPAEFTIDAGDLLIINNHRTLHARMPSSDPDRRLIRIRAWFHRPLMAPAYYVRRATRVAMRTEQRAVEQPLWIRKRLGLSGHLPGYEQYDEEDLLAFGRGELKEDLGAQAQLIRAHVEAAGLRGAAPQSRAS